MLKHSLFAVIAFCLQTATSAQAQMQTEGESPVPPPTQTEPVIQKRKTEIVCRQDDLAFSVRRSVDGTVFAIDFVNEKKKLEITFENLKLRYPHFQDDYLRKMTMNLAQQEAALPSAVGICSMMQNCEIQEPGAPMLVDCQHEQGVRKRRLTVQLNSANAYEVKCEEWVTRATEKSPPTLESNGYEAFTKQIVFAPNSCR